MNVLEGLTSQDYVPAAQLVQHLQASLLSDRSMLLPSLCLFSQVHIPTLTTIHTTLHSIDKVPTECWAMSCKAANKLCQNDSVSKTAYVIALGFVWVGAGLLVFANTAEWHMTTHMLSIRPPINPDYIFYKQR